jgi:Ala-tRNA(Pro) deacylase
MAVNDRLQRLLNRTGASYAVLPHGEAFTAQEIAQIAHVKGRQMAKVVVVRDVTGRDVMAVVPAAEQVDLRILRELTGRRGFRLEDEEELARLFPDCEVGAMPPFGHLYGMSMYVDPCLIQENDIFFQAGNHHEVVLMRCREFTEIAKPFYAGACLHRELAVAAG